MLGSYPVAYLPADGGRDITKPFGALAVQQALLEHGMSTGRIRASGMGNVDGKNAASDRVDVLFDGY